MRRLVFLGMVGIAAVFAASVTLILWTTRDAPGARATAPGGPATSSVGSPLLPPPGVVGPPPGPTGGENAGRPPEEQDRALRDATAREMVFKSFRRAMNVGVAEFQERVKPCSLVDASLTLTLETILGGVRVAQVKVDRRGSATDEALACATSALQGHVIRVDSAQPGRTWQVPLTVQPRG
jgi:hypothetical protein